jgi:hypothetical protein
MIRHAAIRVRFHQRPAAYLRTHCNLLSNVKSFASAAIETIYLPALLDVSCSNRSGGAYCPEISSSKYGGPSSSLVNQLNVLSNDRGRSVRLRDITVLPFIDGSETGDETCYCVVSSHGLVPPHYSPQFRK